MTFLRVCHILGFVALIPIAYGTSTTGFVIHGYTHRYGDCLGARNNIRKMHCAKKMHCASACNKLTNCRSFLWVNAVRDSHYNCWLKKSDCQQLVSTSNRAFHFYNKSQKKKNIFSRKSVTKASAPKGYNIPGYFHRFGNCPGMKHNIKRLFRVSKSKCALACSKLKRCKAFFWVSRGRNSFCWLKKSYCPRLTAIGNRTYHFYSKRRNRGETGLYVAGYTHRYGKCLGKTGCLRYTRVTSRNRCASVCNKLKQCTSFVYIIGAHYSFCSLMKRNCRTLVSTWNKAYHYYRKVTTKEVRSIHERNGKNLRSKPTRSKRERKYIYKKRKEKNIMTTSVSREAKRKGVDSKRKRVRRKGVYNKRKERKRKGVSRNLKNKGVNSKRKQKGVRRKGVHKSRKGKRIHGKRKIKGDSRNFRTKGVDSKRQRKGVRGKPKRKVVHICKCNKLCVNNKRKGKRLRGNRKKLKRNGVHSQRKRKNVFKKRKGKRLSSKLTKKKGISRKLKMKVVHSNPKRSVNNKHKGKRLQIKRKKKVSRKLKRKGVGGKSKRKSVNSKHKGKRLQIKRKKNVSRKLKRKGVDGKSKRKSVNSKHKGKRLQIKRKKKVSRKLKRKGVHGKSKRKSINNRHKGKRLQIKRKKKVLSRKLRRKGVHGKSKRKGVNRKHKRRGFYSMSTRKGVSGKHKQKEGYSKDFNIPGYTHKHGDCPETRYTITNLTHVKRSVCVRACSRMSACAAFIWVRRSRNSLCALKRKGCGRRLVSTWNKAMHFYKKVPGAVKKRRRVKNGP